MRIAHTRPPDWVDVPAGRLASRLRTDSAAGCSIGLLGVPDDTGVGLNNGRRGAAQGPSAFRGALARYGSAEPSGIAWPGVFDAGDVEPGDSIEETHDRVTAAAGALLDAGLLPVMIGGGHDLTFPFVRALADRTDEPLHGVYFDAHLDVRAETGSGMPFRALVERCGVGGLTVHGLDRFANSAEHVRWFEGHGGRGATLPAGGEDFGPDDPWPAGELFVSFDLDVIDQAFAPGVSAMNPSGWDPGTACAWVRAAGRCGRVRCFDIMELSPPHDEYSGEIGRTARLAARLFLEFLVGFTERTG
jgi:arginase family enzyme